MSLRPGAGWLCLEMCLNKIMYPNVLNWQICFGKGLASRERKTDISEDAMKALIVMSAEDNVGNAIEDIAGGDEVSYTAGGKVHTFAAVDEIPFGFKAAVKDIPAGRDIIKYKEVVGQAGRDIRAGECVHIHNVEGKRGRGDIMGEKA